MLSADVHRTATAAEGAPSGEAAERPRAEDARRGFIGKRWPWCEWATKEGQHACFLSHMKAEAGSEARYLNDKLEAMLMADVFLDSNDLVDLHVLCEQVACSDVLVVLMTPNVLRRPWCLLEIFFASLMSIPIIPLIVVLGGGARASSYDREAAREMLANLEEEFSDEE